MNSLLERLRRRLRKLGQPPNNPRTDDVSGRAAGSDGEDAPQRRTELVPMRDQQPPITRAATDPERLHQQLPPPTSTRTKAAVLSRTRKWTSIGQAAALFGPPTTTNINHGRLWGAGATRQHNSPFESEAILVDHSCAPAGGDVCAVTSHWAAAPLAGYGPLQPSSPPSTGVFPLPTESAMSALAGALPLTGAASLELLADGPTTGNQGDHIQQHAATLQSPAEWL